MSKISSKKQVKMKDKIERNITLEELKNYRKLSNEYKLLCMMRNSMYSRIHSPDFDGVQGGRKSAGDVSDPTGKAVQLIAEYDEKIKQKNNDLLRLGEKVARFIKDIDDPLIGQMIVLHYIEGKDWGKVCRSIYGYHNYQTCRKRVFRYFGLEK